jgi:pyruvate,water dikinase
MNIVIPFEDIRENDQPAVGGKAFALSRMIKSGFRVPKGVCVTTYAYDAYLDRTGLRERINLELNRKNFKDMRWEEIWDAALRIRSMFLNKPIPDDLERVILKHIEVFSGGTPVVVRSSAPGEDSAGASFAGLHESYVNVSGLDDILNHIRLVWSSLWSDAAMLYRKELALDPTHSAMAVVVQEMVEGDVSGVCFGKAPNDSSIGVIEAVYGLNQGLVDGVVEPDRWTFERKNKKVTHKSSPKRKEFLIPAEKGVTRSRVPKEIAANPPLTPNRCRTVIEAVLKLEHLFETPQDTEWTFKDGSLFILQSRPISTIKTDQNDNRSWYLSLKRSFDNLQELRFRIENELIPQMIETANLLGKTLLSDISDLELADEIRKRQSENSKWVDTYWKEFIPFAHGIRLFGEFYNDAVRPSDPYEFVTLLKGTKMESLERNRMLQDLAAMIRDNAGLADRLRKRPEHDVDDAVDSEFESYLQKFLDRFGDLTCPVTGGVHCGQETGAIIEMLLEIAAHPPVLPKQAPGFTAEDLTRDFLDRFDGQRRQEAEQMLDLARSSYRLRDDDNIHLGRIEARVIEAVNEARARVRSAEGDIPVLSKLIEQDIVPEAVPRKSATENPEKLRVKARQLVGQPAGPGIARGKVRVVDDTAAFSGFKHGEILVCDSVDPNMTFVVPLSAGIVERRGGMLIHGAIIAREYGLPCVTGVPEITQWVKTGDTITVDGYLGIVTVE